jgi:choline dehydrogenase-like flavoprotein
MASILESPPERLTADVVVLGSGPGGSATACLLAEAGREVVLIEEGPNLDPGSAPPFSREEMVQKYRHGGLTVALGRPKVAYVEGRCVGGGSEINSGLYHRIPPAVAEEWRRSHRVEALDESDLLPHYQANERELSVSLMPGGLPAASLRLHEGAGRLGWASTEVPRWFAYDGAGGRPGSGTKQTMTRTFVPRALAAGARLVPGTRALGLRRRHGRWRVEAEHRGRDGTRRPLRLEARDLILACGAIQTPALLRRGGLGRHAGERLHLHPTVKMVARFPEEVNRADMGVPVHQVRQFSPRISLGCSISSPAYLKLAMLDHPEHLAAVDRDWPRMAIYYAMTRGGRGSVRPVPGFRDPLVRYHLSRADLAELAEALRLLGRCLFAAGAEALYPSLSGSPAVTGEGELERLPAVLPKDRANLMTIHLFSTCPLGEDRRLCVADSFGRVHGEEHLWIADASLLPGPPGVNPQGSLLAVVRRNAAHFLDRS